MPRIFRKNTSNFNNSPFLLVLLMATGLTWLSTSCQENQRTDEVQKATALLDTALSQQGRAMYEEAYETLTTGREGQNLEMVQQGIALLSRATDTLIKANDFDMAYTASTLETGYHVYFSRYERAAIRFDQVKGFPVSDSNDSKAGLYINASSAYGALHFPKLAYRLLDTALMHQDSLLDQSISSERDALLRFNSIMNRGILLMRMGNYAKLSGFKQQASTYFDSAAVNYEQALNLLPNLPKDRQEAQHPALLNNIGLLFGHWGKWDSAMYYHRTAQTLRPSYGDIGSDLDNMGQMYLEKGEYRRAISYLGQAVEAYLEIFGEIYYLAEPVSKIGWGHALLGDHETALEYYQQALQHLSIEFSSTSYMDNPRVDEVMDPVIYLNVLSLKLQSLRALIDEASMKDWAQLLPTFQRATQLIYHLRRQTYNDQVSFTLSTYGEELIDSFLNANYALLMLANQEPSHSRTQVEPGDVNLFHAPDKQEFMADQHGLSAPDLNQVYRAMELTQTHKMIELNRANDLMRNLGITDKGIGSILKGELGNELLLIEGDLRDTREQIYQLSRFEPDSKKLTATKSHYEQLMATRDSLIQRVKTLDPNYYTFRYDTLLGSIPRIQEHLASDQLMMQYFWGKDRLYTIKITPSDHQLIVQPIDSLEFWIDAMYQSIHQKPEGRQLQQESLALASVAHKLYKALLGAGLEEKDSIYQRMVIIPDNKIHYLPFQALVRTLPSPNALSWEIDYAAKHFSFSVNYSGSVFVHQLQSKSAINLPPSKLLAVAPFATSDDDEQRSSSEQAYRPAGSVTPKKDVLHFSRTEIEGIDACEKDMLVGKEANLDSFLENAPSYGVLHLATHASANSEHPDQSEIRFVSQTGSPHSWKLGDIPQAGLKPHMVVLSACETGYGPVVAQEGSITLTRAFTLAGARSVIASLWKVNDMTSSELMQAYYQQLNQGLPKDQALQQAQLHVLYGDLPDRRHPYYWSSFVQTGSFEPLFLDCEGWFAFDQTASGMLLGCMFLLAGGSAWFSLRLQKKNK